MNCTSLAYSVYVGLQLVVQLCSVYLKKNVVLYSQFSSSLLVQIFNLGMRTLVFRMII